MAYTFKSGSTPNQAASALGGSWRDLVYKYPNGTIVKGASLDPTKVPIGTIAYTQAEYDGTAGSDPAAGGPDDAAHELLEEVYGGTPEIWYDETKKEWYLVYPVPTTDVPLLYSITTEELKAIFPDSDPVYDKKVTTASIAKLGGIYAGTAEDPYGDPYADFIDQIEKEAKIKPWMKDADMLAIMWEAALEKRAPTEAEISQTNWWKTHSESERAWLNVVLFDPRTADQMVTDARLGVRQALIDAGISNPTAELIDYMSGEWVQGRWSDMELQAQVRGLADPASGITLDDGVTKIVAGMDQPLDTSQQYEEKVRNEVLKWLGPAYGKWGGTQIAQWAGKLRNDPDGMEALTQMLRSQRMALFPEYANENLTYDDIAAPWRNMISNTWGQTPDETDPFFTSIIRMNDYAEASRQLRREGLRRDIGKVQLDIEQAGLSNNERYRPVG